jgi:SAM-dependent methyltransferase
VGFEALKAQERERWDSAPWETMAARLAAIHDHLVARLDPRGGERWLDVATGTGAVAQRAALAGAQVTGVDLSPRMIETARRLSAERGLSVRFDVGDAENLHYEDASFDVVASALGVFLAPDHAAVAGELARVCRVGGRLGLVAWRADPEFDQMRAPFGSPAEPGAGDRRDWGREHYVTSLMGGAFDLEFEDGEVRVTGKSGEAIWRLFLSADGGHKSLVDSLDPRRREKFHRAFVGYFERYREGTGISAPRRYLLVLGRRAG